MSSLLAQCCRIFGAPLRIRPAGLAGLCVCLALAGAMNLASGASSGPLVYVSDQVSGGNGNGLIDPNECNDFYIVLSNVSGTVVTGIVASLGTTTEGAATAQPDSAYPDIPPGSAATNLTPFRISTASWFQPGTPIHFLLSLTNQSDLNSAIPFTRSTPATGTNGGGGCPTLYVFNDGFSDDDPVQVGRLFRGQQGGTTCGQPTSCPGVYDPQYLRHYDAYSFFNRSGQDACIQVDLETRCGSNRQIFSAAYLGWYNAADVCQNYLGDIYIIPLPAQPSSYSFVAPAGAAFVVVVNEMDPGLGCEDYTVTVSSTAGFIDYTPALAIQGLALDPGTAVVLSWSTNAWRFTLESSPTLEPGTFRPVTTVPSILDDQFILTIDAADPSGFYRLRRFAW